jgi:hypothetical protein
VLASSAKDTSERASAAPGRETMYPAAQKWNKGFTGVVFQNSTGWDAQLGGRTLQECVEQRNEKFQRTTYIVPAQRRQSQALVLLVGNNKHGEGVSSIRRYARMNWIVPPSKYKPIRSRPQCNHFSGSLQRDSDWFCKPLTLSEILRLCWIATNTRSFPFLRNIAVEKVAGTTSPVT